MWSCVFLLFLILYSQFFLPGVLNGPDIRKLMKDARFDELLIDAEYDAWQAIKKVIESYLSKDRSTDYVSKVHDMMTAFESIDVNMSLKIHLLHHHLEHFNWQLATESDEQGERFHQTALPFELR